MCTQGNAEETSSRWKSTQHPLWNQCVPLVPMIQSWIIGTRTRNLPTATGSWKEAEIWELVLNLACWEAKTNLSSRIENRWRDGCGWLSEWRWGEVKGVRWAELRRLLKHHARNNLAPYRIWGSYFKNMRTPSSLRQLSQTLVAALLKTPVLSFLPVSGRRHVWSRLSCMATEAFRVPASHSHWSHIRLIKSDSRPASWLTQFALIRFPFHAEHNVHAPRIAHTGIEGPDALLNVHTNRKSTVSGAAPIEL